MLRVLPLTFKPVLQQISLLQVAWTLTFDWIKITRDSRHTGELSYVTFADLRPVKRATCTDFVAKSRTTLYFRQQLFAACTTRFVARQVWVWVVKLITSLFNQFWSNVAKEIVRLCCLFSRKIWQWAPRPTPRFLVSFQIVKLYQVKLTWKFNKITRM